MSPPYIGGGTRSIGSSKLRVTTGIFRLKRQSVDLMQKPAQKNPKSSLRCRTREPNAKGTTSVVGHRTPARAKRQHGAPSLPRRLNDAAGGWRRQRQALNGFVEAYIRRNALRCSAVCTLYVRYIQQKHGLFGKIMESILSHLLGSYGIFSKPLPLLITSHILAS